MTTRILNGRKIADEILADISHQIDNLSGHKPPRLGVILAGDHGPSEIYVRYKQAACEKVGIDVQLTRLDADVSTDDVIAAINIMNNDPSIHGILVQLPLPEQVNTSDVIEAVAITKDVDGFHPYHAGRLAGGHPSIVPCTPRGCLTLIRQVTDEIAGKTAVVVGRSRIVGKPMADLLLSRDCGVITLHKFSDHNAKLAKQGDILVTATGEAGLITPDWVKPGAIVIDVGISRHGNGGLTGDVDFETVRPIAGAITPVPGGVGPMTIASLCQNLIRLYRHHTGIDPLDLKAPKTIS